ncbi:FAD-dependent monooxygenase [Rathayibacter soli]|uniref:FAD-dependent monooxygenase n=1 Tax=Rathayibacter soli TaxID=3144168 RepID=UPI0027E5AC3A|nr:FAD-dependent monooxygenase [Glaciibacter superstes]
MTEYPVVIVGGGPTGMMLAAELKLAGIDAPIIELRTSQERAGSRAGGLHARTIEVFDQRGIAERMLSAGTIAQVAAFNSVRLDISDFPTPHPYGLGLWQKLTEQIMADWLDELGVKIEPGHEVVGVVQDDAGVSIRLADGEQLRAQYLVGCDGGRSLVRKSAGIEFGGSAASVSNLLAEVEFEVEFDQTGPAEPDTGGGPEWGLRRDEFGIHALSPIDDGKRMSVLVTERQLHTSREPGLEELREAMVEVWGSDFGARNPVWISRFTDAARQAKTYRAGRILLAGDAAHIHYPVGGQGLNLGVQDAVNLGWKLAQVVKGVSPDSLLDSYQAERHPIAAGVLRDTMAQVALRRTDDRTKAVADVISELLALDEPRRVFAGRMSGLGIHYDLGVEDGSGYGVGDAGDAASEASGDEADAAAHPLIGRRMPDLALLTADGHRRVFELLRNARPLLLNFGEPHSLDRDLKPWADRVRLLDVDYDGEWELPVLGAVTAPSAVLIRPDGYVCWVGARLSGNAGAPSGLEAALTKWFGSPT